MSQRDGRPDKQQNPDADLTRSFGIGCGVLFLVFLLMWLVVWLAYLRG